MYWYQVPVTLLHDSARSSQESNSVLIHMGSLRKADRSYQLTTGKYVPVGNCESCGHFAKIDNFI